MKKHDSNRPVTGRAGRSRPDKSRQDTVLRAVRLANDMTQAEFAARMGLSLPSVKRLESNGGLPKNAAVLRNLRALATLAGIELVGSEHGSKC